MQLRTFLLSAACVSLLSVLPTKAAEGEEGGETSPAESSKSFCEMTQDVLFKTLEEIFGEGYNVSINCVSFDANAALSYAVVSGFGESREERLVIECRAGGVLVTSPSPETPDRADIRERDLTGCLSCSDNNTGADICVQPCDSTCERCYGAFDSCTRCRACVSPSERVCESTTHESGRCDSECGENQEPDHEHYNICECEKGYYKFIVFPGGPGPDPDLEEQEEIAKSCEGHSPEEVARPFRCSKDCSDRGFLNFAPNNATGTCFACGLEDCFFCEHPDELPLECNQCIAERVLFEGECFSCPRAEIAFEALEQEHEIEEEEEKKRITSIELAVSLPIVCVLVILFFILMSAFAHHRYPHISHRGHKRHRKPAELETTEEAVASDEEELESSHVWRARPTIRLR